MLWFVRFVLIQQNRWDFPKQRYDYILLDPGARAGHLLTSDLGIASRFNTKEQAESAVLLLCAKVPDLIGKLRPENRPAAPARRKF